MGTRLWGSVGLCHTGLGLCHTGFSADCSDGRGDVAAMRRVRRSTAQTRAANGNPRLVVGVACSEEPGLKRGAISEQSAMRPVDCPTAAPILPCNQPCLPNARNPARSDSTVFLCSLYTPAVVRERRTHFENFITIVDVISMQSLCTKCPHLF